MENFTTSEHEMFSFFDLTLDLVCIASKDGYFLKFNPAVVHKLGYTEAELLTRPIASFIHSDDLEQTRLTRSELLNGKPLINFQNRYVSKNGDIVWMQWTSIYIPEKELVFGIAKDVTEKKLEEFAVAERYNKFKDLASHFKSSTEKEKRSLAAELHEELAQLATVVKMDINWLKSNHGNLPAESLGRIDNALNLTNILIKAIRKISYNISPKILDEFGLNEALTELCKEFSNTNGVDCTFEANYNEEELSSEMKLDFFRVCQEALNNILYHADAQNVQVVIESAGADISLKIKDDGVGFDTSIESSFSGIANMHDRMTSLNGELKINSQKGSGTTIQCVVPKTVAEYD